MITGKDRMENETVWKELRVEKVSEKMKEKQLGWFGHVRKSEEEGLSKRVMGLKLEEDQEEGQNDDLWTA